MYETELKLSVASLIPQDALDILNKAFGRRFENLAKEGRIILATALVEPDVNHRRLLQLVGGHARDLTLTLGQLVRDQFLIKQSKGPWSTYRVKLENAAPPDSDETSQGPVTDFDAIDGGNVAEDGAKVEQKQGNAKGYDGDKTSSSYDETSGPYDETSGPYDETSALSELRGRKRASDELVGAAILELCRDRFLSVEEIASEIGRASSTVRNRYLPRLVRDGQLELLHPDQINHPRQAYRACRSSGKMVEK